MKKTSLISTFMKATLSLALPLLFVANAGAQVAVDSTYLNLDDKFKNGIHEVNPDTRKIEIIPAAALRYTSDDVSSTYYAYRYDTDSLRCLTTDFNISILPHTDRVNVIDSTRTNTAIAYPDGMSAQDAFEAKFMVPKTLCPQAPAPRAQN